MIRSVDVYLLLGAAIVGFCVAAFLLVLRPPMATAQPPAPASSNGHARHGRAFRDPAPRVIQEAAADDEIPSEVGPYPRLATKVRDLAQAFEELEHKFKLISTEWTDKESRLDSIAKRLHRLRKIESLDASGETEAEPAAAGTSQEQRAAIWRKARG